MEGKEEFLVSRGGARLKKKSRSRSTAQNSGNVKVVLQIASESNRSISGNERMQETIAECNV